MACANTVSCLRSGCCLSSQQWRETVASGMASHLTADVGSEVTIGTEHTEDAQVTKHRPAAVSYHLRPSGAGGRRITRSKLDKGSIDVWSDSESLLSQSVSEQQPMLLREESGTAWACSLVAPQKVEPRIFLSRSSAPGLTVTKMRKPCLSTHECISLVCT